MKVSQSTDQDYRITMMAEFADEPWAVHQMGLDINPIVSAGNVKRNITNTRSLAVASPGKYVQIIKDTDKQLMALFRITNKHGLRVEDMSSKTGINANRDVRQTYGVFPAT